MDGSRTAKRTNKPPDAENCRIHAPFEEIETVLYGIGFTKRQEGTSHVIFILGRHRIQVPKKKPFVKPVYVKKLLEELDRILELEDLEEED